jgi:hypothetical protein
MDDLKKIQLGPDLSSGRTTRQIYKHQLYIGSMRKLSKEELLKVFTKIPNDFINDFYDILKNKDADFPIDLDIVTKWLMTRKKDLIDTP